MVGRLRCALSIDLESWVHRDFMFTNLEKRKKMDDGYIQRTTSFLLDLLSRYKRKLTFFVVSEVFDWYPDLIHRIESQGHEIAHHTHSHRLLVSKDILTEELSHAEKFLQEFKPKGFRAPEARLDQTAVEALASYGFEYDSSSYGLLRASRFIGSIMEIPISTIQFRKTTSLSLPRNMNRSLIGRELPIGSGFFLSGLGPFARLIPQVLRIQNQIPVLFVHPWQIEPHASSQFKAQSKFRSIAMQFYSRRCVDSLTSILKGFETVCLRDLMFELKREH